MSKNRGVWAKRPGSSPENTLHERRTHANNYGCVRALTSLVAEVPREGGLALAAEVYSPHLDLHQRILVLDTLSAAAQQLSLPPSQAKTLQRQAGALLLTGRKNIRQSISLHERRPKETC